MTSNRDPTYFHYGPLSTFISGVKDENDAIALDNDAPTLEKERSRLQAALGKICDSLRIVETVDEGDGNTFVFNTQSRDYIDKIREYFTKNESAARYDVSVTTHALPLEHLKNDSMRFLQETVTVHRHAFKRLHRSLPRTLILYGVASSVAFYLFVMIMRIVVKLFVS